MLLAVNGGDSYGKGALLDQQSVTDTATCEGKIMRIFGKFAIGAVTAGTALFMAPAANAAEAEPVTHIFPSGDAMLTLELLGEGLHTTFAVANNITTGVGKLVPIEGVR
jgi:hypothetical protein